MHLYPYHSISNIGTKSCTFQINIIPISSLCEENVLKFNSRCVKLVFCVYVYAMKDRIIRIVILTRSTLLVDVAMEIDLS